MTQPDGERIVALETEVSYLKKILDEVRADTQEIKKTLSEAKGGWKTLMLVAGIASTIGALLAKVVPFLSLKG